jgi:glycerol-3-phosphate cytidylyltransferase
MGERLIVALSTDEFNLQMKNKVTAIPYSDRKAILESLRCVDLVVPEKGWDQKILNVQEYKANIFVMGDDWIGKFEFLKTYCDVVYLARTQNISTTEIKKHISSNHKSPITATSFN